MKERIKIITAVDLLFLSLLIVSSFIGNGTLSELFRYAAFLIPIALGYVYASSNKTENDVKITLLPRTGTLLPAVLLFLPTVALTVALAFCASLLRELIVESPASPITGTFTYAIVIHALIPAVLEEMLFRYLPVRILGKSRYTILLSAMMFSLAHTDLLAIPHTFFAGALLALLAVITDSILPSILLHLLNNTISLTVMYYPATVPPIAIALGIGAGVSAVLLIALRKKIVGLVPRSERDAEQLSYAPLAFIGASIFVIVTESFL